MTWVNQVVANAPEIFLFLALAIGTVLGRVRIRGFAIGATACTLLVAVVLGQLGVFVIPPMLKSIFFGLFVFTIGYRSGPEFFASLSFRTLAQVALVLVMGAAGLLAILIFAHTLHLDAGTAAGLGAGSLTQTSMMGTAAGALEQLGLSPDLLKQQQANIAAGYAVTYVCGYILVLLYVPLVAPWLMRVNLRQEAAKLEAALAGDAPTKPGNLLYRKFQARAYEVSAAAGRTIGDIEAQIGRRAVIERILRRGQDVEPRAGAKLEVRDEVLLAGPSAAIVAAAPSIGHEIEGEHVMRSVPGEVLEVFVTARDLHGRTLAEIVDELGDTARGVFLRALTRRGQEVPVTPGTRIYVGDVMTLVGLSKDLERILQKVGQALRAGDRTDIAFLAIGLAVGLLVGLLGLTIGSIPLTLGGGGGALVAGLVCGGWLRSRRPTWEPSPRPLSKP
jgi:putative transport protein